MKKHLLLIVTAVVVLPILLGSCSLSVKHSPPTEYSFVRHYILNTDVYEDETGQLYLYKPGMGTFPVWDIVADPPDFIQAQDQTQIVQGD